MTDEHLDKPANILLVEDNPADARLTVEALKEARALNELSTVQDGAEAIDFLRRRGRHAHAPRPDVIFLDLNLPKKNGIEVLREIKTDPEFGRIPVVVLTSSRAEQDIVRSYNLQANCFVTKPVELDAFLEMVKSIEVFWMTVVSLPGR